MCYTKRIMLRACMRPLLGQIRRVITTGYCLVMKPRIDNKRLICTSTLGGSRLILVLQSMIFTATTTIMILGIRRVSC